MCCKVVSSSNRKLADEFRPLATRKRAHCLAGPAGFRHDTLRVKMILAPIHNRGVGYDMSLAFNEQKATQTVAAFLKLGKGRLNVLKLVKLVYLADRLALVTGGRPITFDQFFSLPKGPVVSSTLNLINDEPDPNEPRYWHRFISERMQYEIALRADPGAADLSRFEEQIIEQIYGQYGQLDQWALVKLTHKLPEWSDPGLSSIPIHIHEILEAEGFSPDVAKEIEHALEHESALSLELAS